MSDSPLFDWRLSQVFGGDGQPLEDIPEADIVSSVEFDETGDYLAAGDKGGRIVIFERSDTKTGDLEYARRQRQRQQQQQQNSCEDVDCDSAAAEAAEDAERQAREQQGRRKGGAGGGLKAEYKFYAEFQSHEAEFDYLKSMDIEEKINKIRFLRRQSPALLLLTTNDKTIKLWKTFQKAVPQEVDDDDDDDDGDALDCDDEGSGSGGRALGAAGRVEIPRLEAGAAGAFVTSKTRKVYANAHAFHIHSISVSSDQETFLSADELKINLWNLENTKESFNIVDMKPDDMDNLSEVITCAEFHPSQCSQFIYSTSKGIIKLADLRAAALCDAQVKTFQEVEDPSKRNYFSDIVDSISDVKFSHCGRYILSRDYMTLKLWDIAMERDPIKVVQIHEHLRPRLCDLYENDFIFDKFECSINHDATQIMSGTYGKRFRVFDTASQDEVVLTASRIQTKPKKSAKARRAQQAAVSTDEDPESPEFPKKTMHLTFHPTQNVMAVASYNNLFIYS